MAQDAPPEVGTVLDGYRFNGGDPANEASWEQVAPIAAPEFGQGAQRLPNGAVVRYGPRGGMDTIVSAAAAKETADAAAGGSDAESVGKLTEGQGKAMLYGGMMAGAERDYQAAREDGYNPASFQNQAARMAGVIPFDGDFFGRLIRDDISDAGNQAELRWAEGNLRQLTGAAATNPEIARVAAINFDRGNDELADQRYRTRAETYQGTRFAAGPGASQLPEYSEQNQGPVAGGVASPMAGGGIAGAAQGGLAPGSYEPTDQLRGLDKDGNGQVSVEELEAAGFSFNNGQWRQGPPPVTPTGGGPTDPPPSPTDFGTMRSAQGEGLGRKVDAAGRGAADFLTFGLSDEIVAGLNTVLPLDRGSKSIWGDSAGDAYQHNLNMQRGIDQADERDVPVSRASGQVAAGVAVLPRAVARLGAGGVSRAIEGSVARAGAPRLIQQAASGSAAGAGYGAAYGFGSTDGNALARGRGAIEGGVWGGVAGGATPVAVNVGARAFTPVANALGDLTRSAVRGPVNALGDRAPQQLQDFAAPNALRRAAERFSGTNQPNVNALRAEQARLEEAVGRPVAAANVINTGGRAMLRGLGTRSDAARDIAENFGEGAAEALPARVGQQGRRILSNDTRTPDELRAALRTDRSAQAEVDYAGPYRATVPVTDEVISALSDEPGRAAMRRARAAAVSRRNQDQVAEIDALMNAETPPEAITAGTMDRIRIAMAGRGSNLSSGASAKPDIAGGLFQRADDIDGVLNNVDDIAPARQAYADASRGIAAVDAGEAFMGSAPDNVAAAMRGAPASATEPFRASAARSIERAAGTTGSAPGIANRLAIPGTPQRQMMDETLGAADANRLATAMRGERDIYRGAQQVNPGVGSQTTNNNLGAAKAAGEFAGDIAGGRPLSAIRRVIGLLDGRGFNQQQSEALLAAMTDPNRTNEVIDLLAERMSRREARNLARAIRYQSTIGLQSN